MHPHAFVNIIATEKAEQNRAAADPWTIIHFSAGLAFGLMNIPLRWAVAASVFYELAEQVFERREWGQQLFATSGPESVPNAIVDTAVLVAGHRLGALWNETGDRTG